MVSKIRKYSSELKLDTIKEANINVKFDKKYYDSKEGIY